jgi:hypothetical protein
MVVTIKLMEKTSCHYACIQACCFLYSSNYGDSQENFAHDIQLGREALLAPQLIGFSSLHKVIMLQTSPRYFFTICRSNR